MTLNLMGIINKEEYLSRLVGALTRLHRDCSQSLWSPGDIDCPSDDEFSIVLNETFPVEVKAVVYEIQVHTLLNLGQRGHYSTARSLCYKAMEAYVDCPLRRARVIERLLYLAILDGESTSELIALGEGVVNLLTCSKVLIP